MDCERAVSLVQTLQAAPPVDRWIEIALACVAIVVAALGVMFAIAGVVIAFIALRGWRELLNEGRQAIQIVAKEEAKKWADVYSDPTKMFEILGVRPGTQPEAPQPQAPAPQAPAQPQAPQPQTPQPQANPEASNMPGEQLVQAIESEPEPPLLDEPLVGEIIPQNEEGNDTPKPEQ
jgi:hypothetical protein